MPPMFIIEPDLKSIIKAQEHSPEGYRLLKELAIAIVSVATGVLLAIPTAYALSLSGASFTACYLASATVITIIAKVVIDLIEDDRHWIGRKVAKIILQKKEVPPPHCSNKRIALYRKNSNPSQRQFKSAPVRTELL